MTPNLEALLVAVDGVWTPRRPSGSRGVEEEAKMRSKRVVRNKLGVEGLVSVARVT